MSVCQSVSRGCRVFQPADINQGIVSGNVSVSDASAAAGEAWLLIDTGGRRISQQVSVYAGSASFALLINGF